MLTAVREGTADVVRDLETVRRRTHALVAHLDDADLERQVHPLSSPLVWDLAHIAAYEDLWLVHRHCERPLLRPDLAHVYDASETPRSARGVVDLLRRAEAVDYLAAVRRRTLDVISDRGVDEHLHEMVLRHELQHTETMVQAMVVGGLPLGNVGGPLPVRNGGERLFERFAGGQVTIGSGGDGFAYDNERPRRAVELAPFAIATSPVTNATWLTFAEGGGYERREWWSDEGWAWKEQYDITGPAGSTSALPEAPADRLNWYEADAFARSQDARLPSEAEWEHAVTTSTNVGGVGRVWEWTCSEFTGYPSFRAHPYREYSEVFFDKGFRVLRGGSWATHGRVAATTFRNWDLPQRWQIFAGVRLATDA
jgi:iron(II)-dependent oxidoreductase